MINRNAPFPQADDFNKILQLLNIENPEKLKDNSYLSIFLGEITERQVSYYLSACDFLGLIDKREFTKEGLIIRSLSKKKQIARLAHILFSDTIFGTIYFTEKLYSMKLDINDVIEIVKENVELNSEEMYKRRTQTVISWVEWFNNELGDNLS